MFWGASNFIIVRFFFFFLMTTIVSRKEFRTFLNEIIFFCSTIKVETILLRFRPRSTRVGIVVKRYEGVYVFWSIYKLRK